MPIHFQIKTDHSNLLVWYLTESNDHLKKSVQLTDNEITKYNQISLPIKKNTFLAVRKMVRDLGYAEIFYLENGKPMVENGHLSITHSGNWIGVQISKNETVGLDIEKIDQRILKIRDRFLNEFEWKDVCLEEVKRTVLCWSAKEAVFKKIGGDTVFFKENIHVKGIREEECKIDVVLTSDNSEQKMELSYYYLDQEYVLVHSL